MWMGEPALRERIAASSGWQVSLEPILASFDPFLSMCPRCSCIFTHIIYYVPAKGYLKLLALRSKQLGRGQYGTAYLVSWDEEKCGEERKDQYKSGEQAWLRLREPL